MDTVSIEFTTRCNLRCVYCGSVKSGYKGQDFDLTNFGKIISELKKIRTTTILVNGHGETTIVNNWHTYCDELIDSGFRLKIITNLSKNFSPEEIKTLARFHRIDVSCDTVDPLLHAQLRKGSNLEVVLENLRKILKAGSPFIAWSCVVSNKNVYSLPEYVKAGAEKGVSHFSFCNLIDYGGAVQHVSKIDNPKQALAAIEEALNYLKVNKITYDFMDTITESLKNKHERIDHKYYTPLEKLQTRDCIEPWTFVQINSKGDILPCCNHSPIGSLNQGSLSRILDGEQMRDLRRGLLSGNLDNDCLRCYAKAPTSIENLKKKVPLQLGLYLRFLRFRVSAYLKRKAVRSSG